MKHSQPNNPFLALDQKIIADASLSNELSDNLFYLCDNIGTRFQGTPGYLEAAEFIQSKFKEYKCDRTELEAFDYLSWKRGAEAKLTMSSPLIKEFPCYALPNSTPTGDKNLKAEVVVIGAGTPAEIENLGKKLKGKLAMTSKATGPRSEVYARCIEKGAIGFIFANAHPGMMVQTGSIGIPEDGKIPAVGIGLESALQIERMAQKEKVYLELESHCHFEKDTSWNVLGEIKGSEHPDEWVIVGGHLDSHDVSPGGTDNASGVLVAVETARLLAKHKKKLKRSIRFMGFACEEVGLLGSHYHAKKHAKEMKKTRFMLNSDCPSPGYPKALKFHRCPNAGEYTKNLSEQMMMEIKYMDIFHSGSDFYPFLLQGVPTAGLGAGYFTKSVDTFYHMSGDTPEKICIDGLKSTAAFAARVLVRAANDDNWPNMRKSKADVKKLLS